MRYSLAVIVTALAAFPSIIVAQATNNSTSTPSSFSSLPTTQSSSSPTYPNSSITTPPVSLSTTTSTLSAIYGNSTVIVTTITTITSCPASVTCECDSRRTDLLCHFLRVFDSLNISSKQTAL